REKRLARVEALPELGKRLPHVLECLEHDDFVVTHLEDPEDALVDDDSALAHAVPAEDDREVALLEHRVDAKVELGDLVDLLRHEGEDLVTPAIGLSSGKRLEHAAGVPSRERSFRVPTAEGRVVS